MNFKINIPVLLLVLISVLTSCQRGEPSIFVVPEDYKGYILVIYNQENGADKEYQDKSRVYRIPSSGVLLSKFTSNPGLSGFPKFYNGSIAPENQIRFTMDRELPSDTIIATGGIAGGVNKDPDGNEVIRFIQYYVGTKEQIGEAHKEVENLDIIELVDPQ
ncbi:DUF6843 domain-containing protein [Sinomicrobium soli]|uniref:DUF6843 domain-containing protein n=1 Tax=Sinomicrobium sp. N-1-3-6 TaxID=2219864 RepID=UPI000DCC3CB0|nr:hypothetical protein [Sinomicrobium sp. N-1-3-6]RAV29703.1 hypothetical protein DN748_06190 [Sinomicrobium sp. N-1-3-6]